VSQDNVATVRSITGPRPTAGSNTDHAEALKAAGLEE